MNLRIVFEKKKGYFLKYKLLTICGSRQYLKNVFERT